MKTTPEYLEPADAARLLKITGAGVRDLADKGKLRVAAVTVRGVRLFSAGDVVTLARERIRRKRAMEAAR